ncbi:MAG: glucoamylase family protein [Acidobacteriota bacterium]
MIAPGKEAAVLSPDSAAPIRAEIFSTERLEQFAEALAASHSVLPGKRRGRGVLKRLEENSRVLLTSYRSIADSMRREGGITPAAEWLVDNFHLVEEQIREIRQDLPSAFYAELPKLGSGPFAGFPRVYTIAWAFVAHTDSYFEIETLRRFIAAYQRVQTLKIGELWALAISLRLVLVENLRRLIEEMDERHGAREKADILADAFLLGGSAPASGPSAASRLAALDRVPLRREFAVRLLARLREEDPAVTPALQWLDKRLSSEGLNADELVRLEQQAQVATHVSVRNVITTMRLLSAVDWNAFFESVSVVEAALQEGTRVAEMDFATRDRYRHAVEELAKTSEFSETQVARRAAAHAREAPDPDAAGRLRDPGHFLISSGREAFEKELACRVPVAQKIRRAFVRWATPGYLASIFVLTVAMTALPLLLTAYGSAPVPLLWLLALLALVPASELAIAVVNRDVTEILGPRRLPKLEFLRGVPLDARTLVAVPVLLTEESEILEAIERLEVHYLGNGEGEVFFALLSDWEDSSSESAEEDEPLLATAVSAMADLNARYGPGPGDLSRFYLFHRKRVWNPAEGVWMGWERKRGKLHELNRLLKGARDTTFLATAGAFVQAPDRVRYVVTLDADTRLARDDVAWLAGTMAHPLNEPVFDPETGRVVEGYGVLQPGVTPMLPAVGAGTLYQRLFSGPRGIDPYAFAVSDVYQDLFGEGIYTGKGIYDVAAFERALLNRVPENALLSHDLFEGLYARAGLVSDILLFEEFPGHYEVAASRQHRWTRGDWQLLPWLRPRVPDAKRRRVANPLPSIARWKILDNLRRSLSAPAAVALLITSWLAAGARPLVWAAFVLGTIALPGVFAFLAELMPRRRGIAKRSFLRGLGADVLQWGGQTGLRVTFLAHQAWIFSDAILRTLVRLLVTRRHLLEWTPAAKAHLVLDLKVSGFYRRMIGTVAIAGAVLLAPWMVPSALPWAFGFGLLWALSPLIARTVSLPPRVIEEAPLTAEDAAALRLVARRTWRYFEDFAGPKENFLPADNFQETPAPVVARRTSPTNIGLGLLSTAAAADFEWIGSLEMAERLQRAFSTLEKLERHRGHFFNWYDVASLAPLEPRYVSTVDSGNLAGFLIALRHACLSRRERPLWSPEGLLGVGDSVAILRESMEGLTARRDGAVTRRQLESPVAELSSLLAPAPISASEWLARWESLAGHADTLLDTAHALALEEPGAVSEDTVDWARAARGTIASARKDATALFGWASPGGEIGETARAVLEELEREEVSLAAAGDRYETAALALRELADRSPGLASRISALERCADAARALAQSFLDTARDASQYLEEMDFRFLFDPERKLFSIGYRAADGRLDPGYYDLLASEARLASFLAIARGDVPASHWYRLGRALTPVGKGSALISWSGSMFEYLMPDLVMDVPGGSLLDQTSRLVVARQIRFGEERGVPWGVSEAAYNARDLDFTYQYSNFGVSGLGLKRGLSEDLVVAPYATGLAAMIDPSAAARNFRRFAEIGARGRYGFYESIDATPSRLPAGERIAIVRAFMAHHQGMTIVALANVLLEGVMRRRFHSEPSVQATEMLLQERTPRAVAVARPRAEEVRSPLHVRDFVPPVLRRFRSPHDPIPRGHILSNGRYSVMTTAAGSGYSRWKDRDISRWREDVTRDDWGTYFFLRDTQSLRVWSAGYQPAGVEADSYETVFYEDRVEIHRRDGPIATSLLIVVSPEADAEVRQLSLTNYGPRPREIEVTSYLELALASPAGDSSHPAFSKLFVQTEFLPGPEALLAHRRPREASEAPIWAAHAARVDGETVGTLEYETDRARFLGRGRTVRNPASLEAGRLLSNTTGPVLDPVFSLRRRVLVRPGETARIQYVTLAADSREEAIGLVDKYREGAAFDRTTMLAWTQAQIQLRHLSITPDEAHLFQRLATRLVYFDPSLRAPGEVLARNRKGKSGLWRHGISGDHPIVLLRIDSEDDQDIVRQLLRAHEYFRLKRLVVDLAVINEQATSYGEDLQGALEALVRTRQRISGEAGDSGGIFVLRGDRLTDEDRDLLLTAARVVLLSRHGSLSEQIVRLLRVTPAPPAARALPLRRVAAEPPPSQQGLEFFNGLGGFDQDGREYVTILGERQWTPAPWINVVANPNFGFLVSDSGSGYTWAGNSRENQLTPWSNDPVSDPPGEAILVRDEETGEVFGVTALPVRDDAPYVARHGQGYSRFEHDVSGLRLELLQFVPVEESVKISRLTLENRSSETRVLSVNAYAEWTLGTSRSAMAPFVVTERDAETGALLARNAWNEDFQGIAFADLGASVSAWTTDRTEFLGRNGRLETAAGLARGARLSGRVGAGFDPCAALQTKIRLAPGEKRAVVFLLGHAQDPAAARSLVQRFRSDRIDPAFAAVQRQWDDVLGALKVSTPDRSMDLMLNRWLLYQTLACRVWGRSAFYQAGGAFGFRDQLQDVLALTVSRRDLTREQILRAASRQFLEGDVQHWWHVPSGKGVRTRISDDRLWLPYCVVHYLDVTEDRAILDERLPFLKGAPLAPGEAERFFQPEISLEDATLYEHCARALDVSLPAGERGLPLMGTGDWNDGMNRIGEHGKGESIWLGWFLHTALWEFTSIAEKRGETERAERWRARVAELKKALEGAGWDGNWYRRAYFDDGTPVGSSVNEECRIDSIAQSWAAISGAGDPERVRRAMAAVEEYLVRRGDGLVLLFTPPFDRAPVDPGYIKGYLPGVRENGGQYTHAALWCVIAFAALGEGDKATELFSILNPVNHASTRAGLHRYKVEPYVAAADIYNEVPHIGRGGWTWYTGSAGWMYRAGVEWILGFRLRGTSLHLDPCIPRSWEGFEIAFRYHSARYELSVKNPNGATRGIASVEIDGANLAKGAREIPLLDDGRAHRIRVVMG